MKEKLEKFINKGSLFDSLFTDTCRDINDDVKDLESKWNFAMNQCFNEVKSSKKRIKGVDEECGSGPMYLQILREVVRYLLS